MRHKLSYCSICSVFIFTLGILTYAEICDPVFTLYFSEDSIKNFDFRE